MVGRESTGPRVRREIGKPDGPVGDDDLAEKPTSLRIGPDRGEGVGIEAIVHELGQGAVLVVYPEGAIPGTDGVAGACDDHRKQRPEIVFVRELQRGGEESRETVDGDLGAVPGR